MKIIKTLCADDMVIEFLQAEYASKRFREKLLAILKKHDLPAEVICNPNRCDSNEIRQRERLLREYRGYQRNAELFEGFPDDITWHEAELNRSELLQVQYINYSFWNELSQGTRLPIHGKARIEQGDTIFNQELGSFMTIRDLIEQGTVFHKLILVSETPDSTITVLEGHSRLTGYVLAAHHEGQTYPVIIGFSRKIREWGLY